MKLLSNIVLESKNFPRDQNSCPPKYKLYFQNRVLLLLFVYFIKESWVDMENSSL